VEGEQICFAWRTYFCNLKPNPLSSSSHQYLFDLHPQPQPHPLQRNPPEALPRQQRSLPFSAPQRLFLKVEPPLTSRTTTTRTQPTSPPTRTTTTRTQHPFLSTVSSTVRQSPAFNSNENANTKFSLPAEKLPQPCLHATIPICRE
jgi:transposase